MIKLLGSPRQNCDGVTRRETLQAGGLAMLGGMFGLPGTVRLIRCRHLLRAVG